VTNDSAQEIPGTPYGF